VFPVTEYGRQRKRERDAEYRARKRLEPKTPEQLAKDAQRAAAWRAANPEKSKESLRRHRQTAKYKARRKLEEAKYVASGGRAANERRRSERKLSPARLVARVAYNLKRREQRALLDGFDRFVLREAVSLCRLRDQVVGGAWHVDHVVPVSRGGDSRHTNLQVVPALWNRSKGNRNTARYIGANP
jgi:5-methylcytosine-specific restriction endonuclease McrA